MGEKLRVGTHTVPTLNIFTASPVGELDDPVKGDERTLRVPAEGSNVIGIGDWSHWVPFDQARARPRYPLLEEGYSAGSLDAPLRGDSGRTGFHLLVLAPRGSKNGHSVGAGNRQLGSLGLRL
jgi:hypothetical protein